MPIRPALLALEDGSLFSGEGIGISGQSVGEVVFNTAMSGYQEILSDPSYARQIVTLTYPHIGNTGTTPEDMESGKAYATGLVIRDLPRRVSNWRSELPLSDFLRKQKVVGIAGIDTRRLTRLLREKGAQNGCIVTVDAGDKIDKKAAVEAARAFEGLKGMDLAKAVTTKESYEWHEGTWELGQGNRKNTATRFKVVAFDFGVKRNILRMLADRGCAVTVVPAKTAAADVLAMKPDGVFLSNGPGDPEPCDVRHRGYSRDRGDAAAGFRHLPRPSVARPGFRCTHPENEVRAPWRQPSGGGREQWPGHDHQPESRLRGGREQLAGQYARDAPVTVRRHHPGFGAYRCTGILLSGAPGGEPRTARCGTAVRPFHFTHAATPARLNHAETH